VLSRISDEVTAEAAEELAKQPAQQQR
jgi:hypothetical protein